MSGHLAAPGLGAERQPVFLPNSRCVRNRIKVAVGRPSRTAPPNGSTACRMRRAYRFRDFQTLAPLSLQHHARADTYEQTIDPRLKVLLDRQRASYGNVPPSKRNVSAKLIGVTEPFRRLRNMHSVDDRWLGMCAGSLFLPSRFGQPLSVLDRTQSLRMQFWALRANQTKGDAGPGHRLADRRTEARRLRADLRREGLRRPA